MGVVATWLSGCGLSHAIPNFTAAGIVTPQALAELDLVHYEALGVSSADDRRKLFYLVQRVKLAVEKERKESNKQEKAPASLEEQVDALIQSTTISPKIATRSTSKTKPMTGGIQAFSGAIDADEDPLEQAHGEATSQQQEEAKKVSSLVVETTKDRGSPPKQGKISPSRIPAPSTKRSPSKLLSPKALSLSSSIDRATSPGEKTTPTKCQRKPLTATASNNVNKSKELSGSSTWDEGEEEECADDEASTSVQATTNATRRSKRLAEKGKSEIAPEKTKAEVNNKHPAKTLASSKKSVPPSGLKTPQPKFNMGTDRQVDGSNKPGSSLPRPASSRMHSKMQNPSKSMRTGKQLSTIPSDSILPMSPMPPAQLDAGSSEEGKEVPKNNSLQKKQSTANSGQTKKSGMTGVTSRSRSRRSLGGSVSDSSDSESKGSGRGGSRSKRTSLDGSRLSRLSSGSVSDSDSSINSRRRSMGPLSAPKAKSTLTQNRTSSIGVRSTERDKSLRGGRSSIGIAGGPSSKKATETATNIKKSDKVVSMHGGSESTDSSWKAQIASLRQEVNLEHELFSEDVFHDEDDDETIKVIVRKRPFNDDKPSDIDVIHPLEYGYYGKMLVYQPVTRVDLTKEINAVPFAFDGVFGEQYDNSQIYEKSVRNMIPVVLDGQHATVFAFGATGSGKTHTMMGSNFTGSKIASDNNMGLYYMAALDVFNSLEEPKHNQLSVGVSLFEIYGGKLFDLLNDRKAVKCLEDHKGKVNFPGLSEHKIESPGELIELIELGAMSRSTGTTSRNADSSRSHAVLQMHLRKDIGRKCNIEHGRLTFIDLAGSERGADTANFSRATRLEGAEINTSLLALKEVIRARARGGSMVHVPFRGSKLTQVLKESFVGENSRCLMIACIAPDMDNCEQTLNTLRYADRVKERNPESGALPAKFKRGGRRRSTFRSSASISSIVSSSDQSIQAPYDKRTKKIGTATMRDEDSTSDNQTSIKESGTESIRGKSSKSYNVKQATISDDDLLLSSVLSEEDDTDAMLSAVLSEDAGSLVSDNEKSQANTLVHELVATHETFLEAVFDMVTDEMHVTSTLKPESYGDEPNSGKLESLLLMQESLITDLRECFQTYDSIQSTVLGEQLQSHRMVLTALLDIVKEELSITKCLDDDLDQWGDLILQLEALQESKLVQLSVLQDGFSKSGNGGLQGIELKGSSEILVSGSIVPENENDDDNLSEGSFEDLRV